MTGYAGSRDYVGICSLREEPHTDPNIPLRKMILALSETTGSLRNPETRRTP